MKYKATVTYSNGVEYSKEYTDAAEDLLELRMAEAVNSCRDSKITASCRFFPEYTIRVQRIEEPKPAAEQQTTAPSPATGSITHVSGGFYKVTIPRSDCKADLLINLHSQDNVVSTAIQIHTTRTRPTELDAMKQLANDLEQFAATLRRAKIKTQDHIEFEVI